MLTDTMSADLTGITNLTHKMYTELWNSTQCDDGVSAEVGPETNIGFVRHYLDTVHITLSCLVDNTCYFIGRSIISLVFVTITRTNGSYIINVISAAKPVSQKILEHITALT